MFLRGKCQRELANQKRREKIEGMKREREREREREK
jgi:hypothetical protein